MFNIKKNLSLWIGLSIPVVMVALVILSVYLPKYLSHPKHSFIFTTNPQNYYRYTQPTENTLAQNDYSYEVVGGKLTQTPITYYYYSYDKPSASTKLYLYDVTQNKSREISFNEARQYTLDPSTISPDGYEITQDTSSSGFFPFFYESSRDYNSRYLHKGLASIKLNLPTQAYNYSYYNNSFQLLGWVTK